MRPGLKRILETVAPTDIHERASGRCFIAVNRLGPLFPPTAPDLVHAYHSRAEFIDACLASCHIPLYFDGTVATRLRDGLVMDGGFSNFLPVPPGSKRPLRVSCFPLSRAMDRAKVSVPRDMIAPDSPRAPDRMPQPVRKVLPLSWSSHVQVG